MTDLSTLPPLRDIIKDHGLRAEKKLGQNFILDLNLTDKIARTAGNISHCTVFEVGPGPGGLTRSLLGSDAHKVVAVEFDLRAVKALQSLKEVAGERLSILHEDALETDFCTLSEAPRAIVANLPYNIATPLLIKWLRQIAQNPDNYESMTLMFQKEVADRIIAETGSKSYGRLAVLCQWLCDAHLSFDVRPEAFTPPPKVTSSIVHLKPKKMKNDQPSFESVEKITAAAFGQRRKMIRSSLKEYTENFTKIGLEETIRAENMSVDQFIKLAKLAEI